MGNNEEGTEIRIGWKSAGRVLLISAIVLILVAGAGVVLGPSEKVASAQSEFIPIPATEAFNNPPVCSDTDLHRDLDLARINPEWKPVEGLTIDPLHPSVSDKPTILEGTVPQPPDTEGPTDQAPAEVAEEDIPWNHYTHDFTFQVIPDVFYNHLLSSWANPDGTVGRHTEMEVEWENASAMKVNDDDDRVWGGAPEFVWPSVGDRVWVAGRWIFDCGHPSSPDGVKAYVKFSTEIHPPRALVTFRLNHPALSSLGSAFSESWLPVTGVPTINPEGQPSSDPTHVPVTEADIFISGNGGGANDLCMLEGATFGVVNGCLHGHTNPVIPVNDMNYVFDIYPPGTDYDHRLNGNGPFVVNPPVPDASLQWRIKDQWDQVPGHACGGTDRSGCVTVDPIVCLIDDSMPPPDETTNQTDTRCPKVPPHPTRLRVILPFNGSGANYFAKSILLGWDDVPSPSNTPAVRTFRVSLHEFDVLHNDETCIALVCLDGDWRVFVDVGGQWRYMSPLFDGAPHDNVGHGDALTENGDGDWFRFDDSPWIVSVEDGSPIHVAVGGFESDNVDSDFCGAPDNRGKFPNGCDPFGLGDEAALAATNDDRIGTYEFDLKPSDNYAAPAPFTVLKLPDFCFRSLIVATCDRISYAVEFRVREIESSTVESSRPLQIGDPNYGNYVTSQTPLTLTAASRDYEGFQYRFHIQGGPLPTYTSKFSFPVHWTSIALPGTTASVPLYLDKGNPVDGAYDLQYSNENSSHQLEPRHTETVILDNTPPIITINQPMATQYPHSAKLTLDYTVDDGSGSGVASVAATLDGASTLDGHGLASGQEINLLTELTPGTHTFEVKALDHLGNASDASVTFTIIVTPASLAEDVNEFLSDGCIDGAGIGNALTSKLDETQRALNSGNINTAINTLKAFLNQVQAQSGKHIFASCTINGNTFNPAGILIGDVTYLMATLGANPSPIIGYVVDSSGTGVSGAMVSITDSGNNTVMTTVTDVTGFYFLATTGVLTGGSTYGAQIASFPLGYTTSTPVQQSFTWQGKAVSLGNFVLN